MGKTSQEEGDNKLFVEKAYSLNLENAHQLVSQLGTGKNTNSIRQYVAPELAEKNFEIAITAERLKVKADDIKALLASVPGEEIVYLVVGEKKIKTSYKISASPEFKEKLRIIIEN